MPAASTGPEALADSPVERLAQNVTRLTRGMFRLGKEDAREVGLSPPKLFLLLGLREDGPTPASRWVEQTGATAPAMSALLDGLEAEGLISRTDDPTDRRQVLIALTPKGRRIAEKLRGRFRARWKSFCAGIPDARLEAAAATVGRIVARLEMSDTATGVAAVTARKGS